MTSESVNDVPLMGDLTRKGVDVLLAVSTVLEGDNVSSGNRVLGFIDLDEGRRSRESGEKGESEDDEVLGEHINNARDARKKMLELGGGEFCSDFGPYLRGSQESVRVGVADLALRIRR